MITNTRPNSALGMATDAVPGRFRTLQYQPNPGERWYHVLFGHVPRYQMEFILRPELPYRKFRPQHFAHLGPQIKFLAPPSGQTFAFAIGNLSSNDTQHIPGRGGISLLVSTRVAELRDHAQRESPVFAHGLITIDELFAQTTINQTMSLLLQHVLQEGQTFYRGYYISGQADNLERVQSYIRALRGLPAPDDVGSTNEADVFVQYLCDEAPRYNQVLIDCRQLDIPGVLALLARLAVLLYRSNLKWSTLTTGSEPFEPRLHQGSDFGVSIRLLCEGVADDAIERHLRDVQPQSKALLICHGDLPQDDDALAFELFGAAAVPPIPAIYPPSNEVSESPGSPHSLAQGLSTTDDALRESDSTQSRSAQPVIEAVSTRSDDTERDLPVPSRHMASDPKPLSTLQETAERNRLSARRPAATPVRGPARQFLSLCGGLLLGVAAGAGGMRLGLAKFASQRQGVGRPSLGTSPSERSSAAPVLSAPSEHPTSQPSGELADVPPPLVEEGESVEARHALAKAMQQQATLFSTQARFLQDSLARQRSTGGVLTKPYQVLAKSADKLQNAIEQLNHVATAITLDGSVYRLIGLTDSYCDARSAAQQARAAASPFKLDIPNANHGQVAGKP